MQGKLTTTQGALFKVNKSPPWHLIWFHSSSRFNGKTDLHFHTQLISLKKNKVKQQFCVPYREKRLFAHVATSGIFPQFFISINFFLNNFLFCVCGRLLMAVIFSTIPPLTIFFCWSVCEWLRLSMDGIAICWMFANFHPVKPIFPPVVPLNLNDRCPSSVSTSAI